MMNEFGFSDQVMSKLHAVFTHYPEIEEVLIYGSRAKGNHKQYSDVDITVKGTGLNKTILHRLIFEIDDMLLPYNFDISIYEKITNPDVISHIMRVGKTLYLKEKK